MSSDCFWHSGIIQAHIVQSCTGHNYSCWLIYVTAELIGLSILLFVQAQLTFQLCLNWHWSWTHYVISEPFHRGLLGGWVIKMELLLTQLSTKLDFKFKLSLAILVPINIQSWNAFVRKNLVFKKKIVGTKIYWSNHFFN